MQFIGDFLSLFFPKICLTCNDSLARGEEVICTACEYKLPQTDFQLGENNPVEKYFWGRVKIERAASLYYFSKGTRIQKMIHQLKYRSRKDIGLKLGKLCGNLLKTSGRFDDIDMILPVPLHRKKIRRRSYNQCAVIAEGMSEAMGIPWFSDTIEKTRYTATQTKKTRFERWMNVEGTFKIDQPELIANKHILLVDDVITTGATLEACSAAILQNENVKVSIATVATAQD